MKRKKIAILPRLDNRGGDALKKWQVVYWMRNPKTDKLERFRINKGLSGNKTYQEKSIIANAIIKELTDKITSGWSPFLESKDVVYEDELRYRHVSKIYRKARASNNSARYCASKWVETLDTQRAKKTIETYRSKVRIFCDWLDYYGYADNDITTITNDIVLDFFDFLIKDQKLAGDTIKKYRQVLNMFFEYVCIIKLTKINPVYSIPTTNRLHDCSPRPIQEDDIQKLKTVIKDKDPQLWLAILFQYFCALRPGKELRLLRVFDIDFSYGYVYVTAARAKTSKKRGVKIPTVFLNILKNEYKLNLANKNHYVFSHNGKPGEKYLGENNLRYRFNKYRNELGLSYEYKFYSWKHTGALKLLRAGFTIDDISHHLGHTSKQSTEHYISNKFGWECDKIDIEYPNL
jgi:integrase